MHYEVHQLLRLPSVLVQCHAQIPIERKRSVKMCNAVLPSISPYIHISSPPLFLSSSRPRFCHWQPSMLFWLHTARIQSISLLSPHQSILLIPHLGPPRKHSRRIRLIRGPSHRQIRPMLRYLPLPLPSLQHRIFSRWLVDHVRHPCVPAGLDLCGVVFFLLVVYPACSY